MNASAAECVAERQLKEDIASNAVYERAFNGYNLRLILASAELSAALILLGLAEPSPPRPHA
jgi:hypothetical protein